MKDISTAPFLKKMCSTASNMYRLGWDERNGGNISLLLDESEVSEYIDTKKVIRTIPTGFRADSLIGKYFLVTERENTSKCRGRPRKQSGYHPYSRGRNNRRASLGYSDGGRFTSELPSHLMSHMARLSVDPENRVIMHSHLTIRSL